MKDKLYEARAEIDKIDREMAELFSKRMKAVERIADYKRQSGLDIFDAEREKDVTNSRSKFIEEPALRELYVDFLKSTMSISKKYQLQLIGSSDVDQALCALGIRVGHGILADAEKLLPLKRRIAVVTDSGVPAEYSDAIIRKCTDARKIVIEQGEGAKTFSNLQYILEQMAAQGLKRGDAVIAVGGGMVGDVCGLAASLYMRGIDFYNLPTTVLAAVDSSIGGKTAVNFSGTKNLVGTFHQPKGVLIDTSLFSTLSNRKRAEGLAESLKMAVTLDEELFRLFEETDANTLLGIPEEIIKRSLWIKAQVVMADERESGYRRILNFGHTLGHAIEARSGKLYHGECVALGMLPMCDEGTRERLIKIFKKLGLPTKTDIAASELEELIKMDKKAISDGILAVKIQGIAKASIAPSCVDELLEAYRSVFG